MIGKWRFRVDDRLKLFEGDGRLVAIEQTQAGKMLTTLAFHTNLDQVTLKQNSVVLADKPETSTPNVSLTTCATTIMSTTAMSVVHRNLLFYLF